MRKMMQSISAEKARIKLEDLCSRSEQCEWELREKMRKWGLSSDDSDLIIFGLKKHKFLDELRYTQAYVNDKIKFSKWGKRKVAMILSTKRVPKEIIAETLSSFDDEMYYEVLKNLLSAKLRQFPQLNESYEGKVKLFRFALQRGFESHIISSILKEILNSKEE